ncbi:MAG: ADP-ribosylation factor-like protein, partial [Promethearchaeia archaeon]
MNSYLNAIFKINSTWFSDTTDIVMLTLYFEEHENTHFFKEILEDTISKLLGLQNLSKVLYVNTPHADRESYSLFGRMIQILTDGFFEANKLHATYNLGLAEILILGGESTGKTAIVDYLIHDKFIPQAAPTLSPQVYDLIFEETDFRVLDICCEEHVKEVFEEHPIEPG